MLQCPNCKATQATGKFCGKCGTILEEVIDDEAENIYEKQVADDLETSKEEVTLDSEANKKQSLDESVSQSEHEVSAATIEKKQKREQEANDFTQKTQERASMYWNFLIDLLKNPAEAFQLKEREYSFGIINIVLFALTFALTLYVALNVFYKLSFGIIAESMLGTENMPFFPVFSRVSFAILILLAIGFLGVLVLEKLTVKQSAFQTMVAQYGGIITPLIFVQVVAIIPALSGSIIITSIILIGSLLIAMFVIPSLMMFEKASKKANNQSVYISLSTIIFNFILTYFVSRISIFTYLEDLLDELSYFF